MMKQTFVRRMYDLHYYRTQILDASCKYIAFTQTLARPSAFAKAECLINAESKMNALNYLGSRRQREKEREKRREREADYPNQKLYIESIRAIRNIDNSTKPRAFLASLSVNDKLSICCAVRVILRPVFSVVLSHYHRRKRYPCISALHTSEILIKEQRGLLLEGALDVDIREFVCGEFVCCARTHIYTLRSGSCFARLRKLEYASNNERWLQRRAM